MIRDLYINSEKGRIISISENLSEESYDEPSPPDCGYALMNDENNLLRETINKVLYIVYENM
jgi:hypothetical protein